MNITKLIAILMLMSGCASTSQFLYTVGQGMAQDHTNQTTCHTNYYGNTSYTECN